MFVEHLLLTSKYCTLFENAFILSNISKSTTEIIEGKLGYIDEYSISTEWDISVLKHNFRSDKFQSFLIRLPLLREWLEPHSYWSHNMVHEKNWR